MAGGGMYWAAPPVPSRYPLQCTLSSPLHLHWASWTSPTPKSFLCNAQLICMALSFKFVSITVILFPWGPACFRGAGLCRSNAITAHWFSIILWILWSEQSNTWAQQTPFPCQVNNCKCNNWSLIRTLRSDCKVSIFNSTGYEQSFGSLLSNGPSTSSWRSEDRFWASGARW